MFLDSTLLIDILRGKENAIAKMKELQSQPLFTSEINVFELVEGVYSSEGNAQKHLEKVLALLTTLGVLPFDRKAALKAGFIAGRLNRQGKKIGETDCMIAGVALANGITEIITQNKGHFSQVENLKIITY